MDNYTWGCDWIRSTTGDKHHTWSTLSWSPSTERFVCWFVSRLESNPPKLYSANSVERSEPLDCETPVRERRGRWDSTGKTFVDLKKRTGFCGHGQRQRDKEDLFISIYRVAQKLPKIVLSLLFEKKERIWKKEGAMMGFSGERGRTWLRALTGTLDTFMQPSLGGKQPQPSHYWEKLRKNMIAGNDKVLLFMLLLSIGKK